MGPDPTEELHMTPRDPDGTWRLTRLATSAGCAAKIAPGRLGPLLAQLSAPRDPRVKVGIATHDDAGVFELAPGLALVQTVDFFPPVVDDPRDFGAIATANALSDVYAMGGVPITALNVLAFPPLALPDEAILAILQGSAEVLAEAGVSLMGGHSIDDPIPKFGLAVTGLVDPAVAITNAGGQVGDRLLLTKPLGMGLATTAMKRGLASPELAREAVRWMRHLNAKAGSLLAPQGAHAATDITGFGLLGHLLELCRGAGLGARLHARSVPHLPEALALARADEAPGGTERNLAHAEAQGVRFAEGLDRGWRLLLADAQTSGGLLIAVPPEKLASFQEALLDLGELAHEVGELVAGEGVEVLA